ncbi:MAG: hypothetical protein RRA15_12290, partial [bacterium]|nr:hypothetical protein [bacterium]
MARDNEATSLHHFNDHRNLKVPREAAGRILFGAGKKVYKHDRVAKSPIRDFSLHGKGKASFS